MRWFLGVVLIHLQACFGHHAGGFLIQQALCARATNGDAAGFQHKGGRERRDMRGQGMHDMRARAQHFLYPPEICQTAQRFLLGDA